MFPAWPGLVLGFAMAFLAGLSDANGTAQTLLSAVLGIVSAGALLQYVRQTPEAKEAGRNAGWVMVGFGVGLLFGAPSGVLARERIRRHLQAEAVVAEAENSLEAAKGKQRVCDWAIQNGAKPGECLTGNISPPPKPPPVLADASVPLSNPQPVASAAVAVLNSKQVDLVRMVETHLAQNYYQGQQCEVQAKSDVRKLLEFITGKDGGQ